MPENASPLDKAAERFDRLAKSLKAVQLAATGATPVLEEEVRATHPLEAWARRFATHTLRASAEPGAPPFSAFQAPIASAPKLPASASPPTMPARCEASGGHIGSGLGKPGPRKSWVARMFRGR